MQENGEYIVERYERSEEEKKIKIKLELI